MRDLKECQAEVFRRSEVRIKERTRRRKSILAACVPLVICLVIAGATMLPDRPTADKIAPESAQDPGTTEGAIYGMGNFDGSPDGALSGAVQEPPDAGEYGAQFIRTDVQQDVQLPRLVVIRSREELEQYYQENKDIFYLGRKAQANSDDTVGFWDACDKYDDRYFEKGHLVMVALEQSSGSIRHRFVGSTYSSDGKLCIYLETIVPEVGTCDMAGWHILVEMRNVLDITEEDVQVKLDGKMLIG